MKGGIYMDRCIESRDKIYDILEKKWKIVQIVREEYSIEEYDDMHKKEVSQNRDTSFNREENNHE